MTNTNSLDRPTQLPTQVADRIFDEILSAMGGYALLKEALGLAPSFLCRGMEGELILAFKNCDRTNKVKITLEGIDSYSMTFYTFCIASVDREQLQHYFEEFTGLSLVSPPHSSSRQ